MTSVAQTRKTVRWCWADQRPRRPKTPRVGPGVGVVSALIVRAKLGALPYRNLPCRRLRGGCAAVVDAKDQQSRSGHADREHDAEHAVAAVRDKRAANDRTQQVAE